MAENHTNEIIEQQRKARQEFLNLKKMQQGEMDAGPKPSELAVAPKTFSEKVKNIWFHDKWLIISVVAIVLVISICVSQCMSRPKYDLNVILYTQNTVGDEDCTVIAGLLSQHCSDLNGDGQAKVNVINCSYSAEHSDKQYIYTCTTKVQAMISSEASALLFITDDATYGQLSGTSENTFFENEPIPLNEKFYVACDGDDLFTLPDGLQISCRKIKGTMVEKNKEVQTFYNESQKILKAIS